VPIVLKSGSLNFLEPSGLSQASNGIALPSVLIMYGIGTSYHYRLFITITVLHVISLAHTKARKQLSTRTPLELVSGLLAVLTHKTDVF